MLLKIFRKNSDSQKKSSRKPSNSTAICSKKPCTAWIAAKMSYRISAFTPPAKKANNLSYETNADLRDSESVPLNERIHRYFQAEVKPHVDEAWINLDSVNIGYEISFNKYFYRHKPLRSMNEAAKDITALEKQAEGLIADILDIGHFD